VYAPVTVKEREQGMLKSWIVICLWSLCLPLVLCQQEQEDKEVRVAGKKRVALVIGNASYQHVGRLSNTGNDARDMAAALKQLGFVVTMLIDGTQEQMIEAIEQFGKEATGSVAALFYYSGHGAQLEGVNYLIPVEASINSATHLRTRCVSADEALAAMETAKTKIVVLDACRDNPVASLAKSGKNGLASMNSPEETIIVFATAPGTTSLGESSNGRNSVFTYYLLRYMQKEGIDINGCLMKTRAEVMRETKKQQQPWEHSCLTESFYFKPGQPHPDIPTPVVKPVVPTGPEPPIDALIWQECWNESCQYFDFTQDIWVNLDHSLQFEYTKAYQVWYGKTKGLALDKVVEKNGARFEFRLIPPGKFWMGSLDGEADRGSDEKRHRALISKPFWMQKTEITQRQWKALIGKTPWSGKNFMEDNDEWAAAYISWDDITKEFVPQLKGKYSLPTEAQWEYVCRGGVTGRFYWGDSESDMGKYANVCDLTAKESGKFSGWSYLETARDTFVVIAPVKSLQPNAFGLHDMTGNVWEWCSDYYGDYAESAGDLSGIAENPAGAKTGSDRVRRGGSWDGYGVRGLRSASRFRGEAGSLDGDLGARVVAEAD
jgi:formylglycine-generating enzyme required for sulfatase activity